jgi:hypothetical protein
VPDAALQIPLELALSARSCHFTATDLFQAQRSRLFTRLSVMPDLKTRSCTRMCRSDRSENQRAPERPGQRRMIGFYAPGRQSEGRINLNILVSRADGFRGKPQNLIGAREPFPGSKAPARSLLPTTSGGSAAPCARQLINSPPGNPRRFPPSTSAPCPAESRRDILNKVKSILKGPVSRREASGPFDAALSAPPG